MGQKWDKNVNQKGPKGDKNIVRKYTIFHCQQKGDAHRDL